MANEAQPFDNRTPLTEGQIRAATIGEPKPLSGPIRVVDYDPRWPELFAREADRFRAALGQDALRIEHVGSTSVTGLVAKPIIDMLLVVDFPTNGERGVKGYTARSYSSGDR